MNNNEKRNNFKRISEKRMEDTIEKFRLIGNLANTSNYEYTSMDDERLFNTLRRELFVQEKKFKLKINQNKIYSW